MLVHPSVLQALIQQSITVTLEITSGNIRCWSIKQSYTKSNYKASLPESQVGQLDILGVFITDVERAFIELVTSIFNFLTFSHQFSFRLEIPWCVAEQAKRGAHDGSFSNVLNPQLPRCCKVAASHCDTHPPKLHGKQNGAKQ